MIRRALSALAPWGLAACTSIVTPPTNPVDPVHVYIADHGRHSSLLLPGSDGRLVEYAYGEWDWFAMNQDQCYRTPGVLFVPTRGALGRRTWQCEPTTAEGLCAEMAVDLVHEVPVSRAHVDALRAELDSHFESRRQLMVQNGVSKLELVPDDRWYWIGHHCNITTAQWLRRLGCAVSGAPPIADFTIRQPAASASTPGAGGP